MNRIKKLLLLCFIGSVEGNCSYNSIENFLNEEMNVTKSEFVTYVFRRFYFIRRLEHAMELLLKFNANARDKKYIKKNHTAGLHNKSFKGQSQLKPLFMVWDDFAGYKDLQDQVLVEDFTKEVFVVSSNILAASHSQFDFEAINEFLAQKNTKVESGNIENKDYHLPLFDENFIEKGSLGGLTKIADLKPFVQTDDVIRRFYYLQRIKYAVNQLKYFINKRKLKHILSYTQNNNNTVTFHKFSFSTPFVVTTIKMMCGKKDFKPFFDTWNSLSRYKYVQNNNIMKEFIALLVILLEKIRQKKLDVGLVKSSNQTKDIELEGMPLEDLLDILDILVDELPEFLEKYEFDSDMSWKEWGRKFAIPAVLGATAIAIKVYMSWRSNGGGKGDVKVELPPKPTAADLMQET